MRRSWIVGSFACLCWLVPAQAWGHVTIGSGPAATGTASVVTFEIGHGCQGADTYRVDVEIPAGVTSVRPQPGDFGQAGVMTDDAGTIVLVSWQKPDSAVLTSDTQYYELHLLLKPPNDPFTTVYFPTHQHCRAADGTTIVSDWVGIDESDTNVEPAPSLRVVPAHLPGWNRFNVPVAVSDLAAFFPDAQIVWSGTAAYSVNPTTMELAVATDGVTQLDALRSGDEIWVRY